jgi:hypothetical protein
MSGALPPFTCLLLEWYLIKHQYNFILAFTFELFGQVRVNFTSSKREAIQ